MTNFVIKLKCSRCKREYSPDSKICICENDDNGRLDIFYDYSAIADVLTKETLRKRPLGVWRYRELLPIQDEKKIITLGEGGTPLIKAERLSERIGLKNLYLKDETRNPTGSFKDRSMTVGVTKALEFGVDTVTIASSGNAAAALAAYSAKAGLKCYAFVLENAPLAKIAQIRLYGATVMRVKMEEKGVDPTVVMMKLVVKKYGWYPCPSFGPFNPYQVEGPKTMSHEIIEQLDWQVPDWVIVPVGSACLLTGVWRGFKDFLNLGFINELPKLLAVQSTGCAPFVRAFKEGKGPFEIEPWDKPATIAGGLSDVYPWDGDGGIIALKETNGDAVVVTDQEILEAQRLLASTEGIFAEPSGVTSLAGLIRMVNEGEIDKDERIVVLITGTGLKDPDIVVKTFKEKTPTIMPRIEEFEKVIKG